MSSLLCPPRLALKSLQLLIYILVHGHDCSEHACRNCVIKQTTGAVHSLAWRSIVVTRSEFCAAVASADCHSREDRRCKYIITFLKRFLKFN